MGSKGYPASVLDYLACEARELLARNAAAADDGNLLHAELFVILGDGGRRGSGGKKYYRIRVGGLDLLSCGIMFVSSCSHPP